MRDAEALGDTSGVVDVLSGAAGPLTPDSGAVVVELQCDADDFEPALGQERRGQAV